MLAAPVWRSTCHIALPTTLPASKRPCLSTARPCTPVKLDGATNASGAAQPAGREGGMTPQADSAIVAAARQGVNQLRIGCSPWMVVGVGSGPDRVRTNRDSRTGQGVAVSPA